MSLKDKSEETLKSFDPKKFIVDPDPSLSPEQKTWAVYGMVKSISATLLTLLPILEKLAEGEQAPPQPSQPASKRVEDVIQGAVGYDWDAIAEIRRVDGELEIYFKHRVENYKEFCAKLNPLFGGRDNVRWDSNNKCTVIRNWKNKGYL